MGAHGRISEPGVAGGQVPRLVRRATTRVSAALNTLGLSVPAVSPLARAILACWPWLGRWAEQRIRSIPALAASVARRLVVPNDRSAPASSASVIVTPLNPSRWRSSPLTMADDSPAGVFGASAEYLAQDTITSLTPAAIAAR